MKPFNYRSRLLKFNYQHLSTHRNALTTESSGPGNQPLPQSHARIEAYSLRVTGRLGKGL
jgi:hypothetical protein